MSNTTYEDLHFEVSMTLLLIRISPCHSRPCESNVISSSSRRGSSRYKALRSNDIPLERRRSFSFDSDSDSGDGKDSGRSTDRKASPTLIHAPSNVSLSFISERISRTRSSVHFGRTYIGHRNRFVPRFQTSDNVTSQSHRQNANGGSFLVFDLEHAQSSRLNVRSSISSLSVLL